MGAKATEGKPEGKPFIGPKRGSAVSTVGYTVACNRAQLRTLGKTGLAILLLAVAHSNWSCGELIRPMRCVVLSSWLESLPSSSNRMSAVQCMLPRAGWSLACHEKIKDPYKPCMLPFEGGDTNGSLRTAGEGAQARIVLVQ